MVLVSPALRNTEVVIRKLKRGIYNRRKTRGCCTLSEVEMLTRPTFVKPTTESSPFITFDEIVLEKAKDATSHRKVRSILFY